MYCFASCVGEQLLYYIRDAGTPKAVWENLKKIFAASTMARKLQLRQERSNLRQQDLSVADYTLKINEICDSLASIDVNIDEIEKVQICLRGLASKFRAFRTTVCTREATLSFFDLESMLLVEENHVGAAATCAHIDSKLQPLLDPTATQILTARCILSSSRAVVVPEVRVHSDWT
jgi:hypothetical protein